MDPMTEHTAPETLDTATGEIRQGAARGPLDEEDALRQAGVVIPRLIGAAACEPKRHLYKNAKGDHEAPWRPVRDIALVPAPGGGPMG